jgi:PII-like signaling protein
MWGFHGDHSSHGDRLLQRRRHVPVVTIVVDDPDRIARSFEIVDEVTRERGLVTSEMVPALAAVHGEGRRGALRLADHRF